MTRLRWLRVPMSTQFEAGRDRTLASIGHGLHGFVRMNQRDLTMSLSE